MSITKRAIISFVYWWLVIAIFYFFNELRYQEKLPLRTLLEIATGGTYHVYFAATLTVFSLSLSFILNKIK